jgi:hypothetical protein
MKRLLPPSSHSNLRVFTACLLSFLIMVSPIASVAASVKAASSPASTKTGAKDKLTPEERMESSLFKPMAAVMPLGGITATKSDSFPVHPSGQAEPGDEISYTVDVGNTSGSDATGVTFTDQIDPSTTLVPGSVNTTPIAYDKSVTTNEDTAVAIVVGADAENDPVTINVITPVAHGTLTGTAPNMTYTPDADFNGSDSFTFKLNDGKADSIDTGTISITITSVNDAPVVTAGGTLNYTENQVAQIIDNSITVTDVDNANATGATVSITSGFQSGADVLSFVNTPNIIGSYNAATGILTLSGSDTKANYQSALRSVKYNNSSEAPTATPRTISWVVTDGTTPSTAVTSTVNVTPVNDAPVLTVGGTLSYTEDQAATALNSSLTVTDVDNANLTGATVSITANFASGQDVLSFTPSGAVTGSYNAATGVLTLSGSDAVATYQTVLRSVKYSNSSQNPSAASRTVTWTATDGTDASAPATSTINVTSVNDAPVVTAGATISYNENDPATAIDNSITVTDVDNANATGATVSITSGFQSGADVLSFVNTPNIIGSYNAATGVLTLSGSDTTANYQTALRNVKYNNSSEAPTAAPRTISWVVTDGITPSTPVTSTVNVVAIDDAPVLTVPGSQTFNEDTTRTFNTANSNRIRVDDPDSGANNITVTISSTHGNITVSTSGVTVTNNTTHSVTIVGTATNIDTAINGLTYTPDSNYNGSDTLALHADDGGFNGTGGPLTADASVTFTIDPVNDAPVYTGAPKTATAIANMPRVGVGGLLTGVTDPDDGEYGFTSVMKVNSVDFSGCACAVAINNATTGTFNITPNVGFAGTTSFTYKVEDNGRPGVAVSAPITVTVTVTGPIIYFVKSAGAGNCTLGNECTLSTAVTAIGAATGRFIFISDANTHAANVPLNSGGSIIGQGLTGFADFDTFFGINGLVPSGTPARPSINQSRPTVNGTITFGATATDTSVSPNVVRGSQARGLNINNTTASAAGIVGNGKTSVVVSDMNVTTTSGTSVSMTGTSGAFTFGDVTSSSGSPIAWSGGADSGTVTFNDVTGSAVPGGATGVSIATNVSDFVFHKISTTGGAKGIVLNTTTGGSFTINGTSTTAGTGGTIQNATNNGIEFSSASSVTLKNMNLTNNAQTQTSTNNACGNNLAAGDTTLCVANLYLNSVSTVALTNLSITGSTQEGIAGTAVSGFTLANSTISGNGNEDYEDGMLFKNLTGTVSVTNTNLQNNFSRQAHIFNTAGSLTFTATGSLFGRTIAPLVSSQQGLLMELGGTSTSSVDIGTSSFVKNGNGNGLAITVTGSATLGSAATHSGLHNSTSLTENAAHVFISTGGGGVAYFDTLNNTAMTKAGLQAIDYFVSTGSTASGQITAIIQGNTIGTSGVAGSACNRAVTLGGCDGMTIDKDGAGSLSLRIQGNTIQQVETNGINLTTTQSNTLNASIIGNTIREPGFTGAGANSQGNALLFNVGPNSGSTTTACLNIGGAGAQNVISDTASKTWDINGSTAAIFLNTKNGTTTRLPGMAGSGAAAAQTFITGNNTFTLVGGANPVLAQTFNGSQIVGGAACTTPLLLGEGGVEAAWNSPSLLSNFAGVSLNDLSFTSSPSTCGGSAAARSGFASSSITTTSLNQQQLDSIVNAAVQRWSATGLTPGQVATLHSIRFDVSDLSGSYLGEADGNHILVDKDAGGNGWYVDATPQDDSEFGHAVSETRRYTDSLSAPAGHVDLLTAIMHEIGHRLDIPDSYAAADRDSLMYGYLTKGERRLPITGQAEQAVYGVNHDAHFLSLLLNDSKPQATKAQARRSASRSFNGHASSKAKALTSALMPSGETVTSNIGSLPTGKHVQITFKVTVNVPFSGTQVSNQGTVAGTIAPATPFSIVTDDPATGASNDATITPVLGPPDAVNDSYTTFKNTPLNVSAPGVLGNDLNNPAATPIAGGPTTAGGTVTLNADGSFSYTPPSATYTGADSFTYTVTNGAGSDNATVDITVSDTSNIYINEIAFNPDSSGMNEYIELRGTPSSTIPAGTYLVAVDGNSGNTGDVKVYINLSGLSFGSNGFLVLLQQGNTYTTAAGAQVYTSTSPGFGGLPGSIFVADGGATSLPDDSTTYMLIQTGVAPTLTDDVDANDDGTADGSVFGGWAVRDSIGNVDGDSSDHGYGALNYSSTGSGTSSGTVVSVGFALTYVGRRGDTTGSAAADWVASCALDGSAPNFTLDASGTEVEPSSYAGKPLNHIGSTNFLNAAPVNTVPGAQNTDEDVPLVFTGATQISIADSDAGSAPVQVTLTASNGIITLSGTTGLSFNSGANGTASMNFNGTITDINNALNNMTFTPEPTNFNGSGSVTILTDDLGNTGVDGNKTDSDVVNITVDPINDPPSFTLSATPPPTVNEDAGAQTVNSFATSISQGAGDPAQTLTFNVSPVGTTGNISFSSGPAIDATTGNLTYTTSADTNGTATFNVTLSDNGSNVSPNSNTSGAQQFTITVTAVNDAPTFQITSNPPAVNEDAGAQTVNSFATNFQPGPATATDETGQTLVGYTVTANGTTGNLTFTSGPSINNAGQLTYTPTGNTSGTATFNVVATDNGSGTSPNVNQSAPVSFTITVTGQNDAPVLDDSGNMTLNAINEDVANASNPGTLVSDIIASAGGDRITDVDAGAIEGIAVIAVNNTNGAWQYSIDNGTNWLPFNSPDATTARLLASNATTRIRFVPAANFNGTVNPGITFRAWDQTSGTNGATADTSTNGGTTAFSIMTETASITVNPVNDAPTANAQTVGTAEDTPVGITLTGSDVETASANLVFNITAAPANGVLSGTGANRTYTPNANYNGPDSFKFTVTDTGDGSSPALTSTEATVTINVGAVNDAPTADAQSVSTNEDTAKAITLTGSDIDTPAASLTYIIVAGPSHGTVSPGTGPGRTYTPTGNYNGPDSFTFKINDGTADSNVATVSITVNAVNDAPTADAQSVSTNEDTPKAITLTGSDTETAPASLVFNVTVQPAHGVLSGTGANRTYTPNADYNGPDSFKFTVTDTGDGSSPALTSSEATVSITVNGVNDAPVNSIPGPQGATKNGQLVFSAANSNLVSIADVDAGSNSLKVTLTSTHGTLTLSGTSGLAFTVGDGTKDATMTFTGNLTNINAALNGLIYEPTNGYDGPATIQLTTDDQGNTGSGGAKTDTDTINVTINPGGILSFSSATYTVAESGGSITITINRVGGSNGTTKVDYATSNGTATAPQDYTAASGQLTFNNGETTKTFVVPIVNDALDEANETVNLTLSNVTGSGELGSPSTAVLTITDDDPTPTLSINDATVTEGNSGTVNAVFTVTLSAQSGQTVTVSYATANGTATAPSDYQAQSNTLTFAPGETTKTVTVLVNGDTASETDETFFVNLTGATNASVSDNQGLGTIISDDSPVIQFNASTYTVAEDALRVIVTVNRLGDISKPATVDYATSDSAGLTNCSVANGIGSSRCDYAVSVGTLRFAANEASKTISIPIVNDVYVEGPENFTITLSHQTGGEAGSPTVATITITDNDNGGAPNPMDDNAFFIRQLYIDFLGREPDPPGLRGWLAILNNCPVDDTSCDRVHIAEGFARSDEFAGRGYFIYRIYRASLGRKPDYAEFIPDMAKVSGFLSPQDLEANKQAFVDEFVTRTEFRGRYDALDNAGYVNALETTSLVTLPNKQALIDDLNAGRKTRAQVLRAVIETVEVYTKSTNEAFVVMEYFGFLRRDPDALYKGWIEQFNHSNIYRLIINGFVFSAEYRQRFGPN